MLKITTVEKRNPGANPKKQNLIIHNKNLQND